MLYPSDPALTGNFPFRLAFPAGIMTGMFTHKLYSVVTLAECMQDPATLAWLVQSAVPLPEATPPGRYPAPEEIRAVIDALPGTRAEYHLSRTTWQVTVTSRKDVAWASLAVQDYCGDPTQAHRVYIEGGWEEIIGLVCGRLARFCGPLVLLPDSGAPPQIILW